MQPRIFDKANQTLVKTLNCNKLSERSKGQLHYQLWQDNDDQSFGIALSGNDSSGGFSAELIKVEQIIATLEQLYQTAKPFHAIALKGLFIGKSVNNASFLGAILVDQGVIRLHPQTTRFLEVSDEYELWPLSFDDCIQDGELLANTDSGAKNSSKRTKTKAQQQASVNMDTAQTEEIDDEIHQDAH